MPWIIKSRHYLELKYDKIGIYIESIRNNRLRCWIAWNALLPPIIGWLSVHGVFIFSQFTTKKSDSTDVAWGTQKPIRHKIDTWFRSGPWHCPTRHWKPFCDREHPKFPWLRVGACRWGAVFYDHSWFFQFGSQLELLQMLTEQIKGIADENTCSHLYVLIQWAWLAVLQLFRWRCCGFVQLAPLNH